MNEVRSKEQLKNSDVLTHISEALLSSSLFLPFLCPTSAVYANLSPKVVQAGLSLDELFVCFFSSDVLLITESLQMLFAL